MFKIKKRPEISYAVSWACAMYGLHRVIEICVCVCADFMTHESTSSSPSIPQHLWRQSSAGSRLCHALVCVWFLCLSLRVQHAHMSQSYRWGAAFCFNMQETCSIKAVALVQYPDLSSWNPFAKKDKEKKTSETWQCIEFCSEVLTALT